jgi:MarR family transcriptional regulator, organic hydroperoxide resistance regulator
MRSITRSETEPGATAPYPTKVDAAEATVEAILTEVGGWVGDLRCASMGRLVQSQVSMSQLHVLWLLQHQGAMTMSRLAELLGVSLSNATGIIDRMETNKLIERVRVPDDRRLVLVQPAAAGRQALTETESTKREGLRAVIRRLSPAERPVVLQALRSLRRALNAEVESSATHRHHFADAPVSAPTHKQGSQADGIVPRP